MKISKIRRDSSKIINSLEKTAGFCDESEGYVKENNPESTYAVKTKKRNNYEKV